jgi:hypothetical protein
MAASAILRVDQTPADAPASPIPRTGGGADLQAPGADMSKAATATARGRTGTPVEVAQAALFPASDTASFGNGAHQFVENGFAAGGGGGGSGAFHLSKQIRGLYTPSAQTGITLRFRI